MYRMKMLKECLMSKLVEQMGHLEDVDAKEMGEVVDMIKDIAEAEYYCTVAKAMKEGGEGVEEWEREEYKDRGEADRSNGGRRTPARSSRTGRFISGRSEGDPVMRDYARYNYMDRGEADMPMRSGGYRNEADYIPGHSDGREYYDMMGELNPDLGLENYMTTMSQHLTKMIQRATPEEKEKLKHTLTTLASKVR